MAKAQNKNESDSKTKKIVLWISVFLLILAIITTALLLTLCDAKGDDITGGGDAGGGDNPIVECEHNIEILPAVAPTCEEKGLTEGKKCSKCGEIILAQEEVSALGHNWGEWRLDEYPLIEGDVDTHSRVCLNDSTHIDVELCDLTGEVKPTCFEDGYLFCEICGRKDSPEGYEATGHVWGELVDNGDGTHTKICANDSSHTEIEDHILVLTPTEPTCEEDGIYMDVCECGYSCPNYNYEPQWPLGHDYVWTDNGDGTCTGVCSRDATHTITQSHEFEVIGEDPDCENGGYCHETCFNCGLYVYTEYDPLGHIWLDWSHDESKTAEEGVHYHSRQCQRYWDDHINCTDHDYAPCTFEVIEEVPATCLVDGSITYECTGCGYTYTETVTARGNHNFDYEDRDETNHFSICADCGEAYNIEPHTEYLTETVVPATCEAQGYTEYMCTYCFYTYKDNYVDALGHNFDTIDEQTPMQDDTIGVGALTHICSRCDETHNVSRYYYETEYNIEDDYPVLYSAVYCPTCDKHLEEIGEPIDDLVDWTKKYLLPASFEYEIKALIECGWDATLENDITMTTPAIIVDRPSALYLNGKTINVTGEGFAKLSYDAGLNIYMENGTIIIDFAESPENSYLFDSTDAHCYIDGCGTIITSGNDIVKIHGNYSNFAVGSANKNDEIEFFINGENKTFVTIDNALEMGSLLIELFCGVYHGYDPTEYLPSCKDYSTGKYAYDHHYHAIEEYDSTNDEQVYTITRYVLNIVEAVAPTCTATGLTEGKQCSECGKMLIEQEEIPALGHAYPDTWTDNGDNHIKVCANGCGIDLVEEHSIQNYWLDPETKIVYYAQYCDICGTHVAERGDEIRTEDYLPVKTEYELRAILESVGGAELHAQVLNDITVDTPIYIDDIRHVTLSNGSALTGTGTDEEGRYALFVANAEFYPYTSAEDDTVGGTFSVEGPAGEDAYIVVTNVCVETNIGNEVEGGTYKTTGDALFFMIDGASLLNHGPAMYITGSDSPTMVEGNIGGVRAHSGTFVNWDPTEYFEDKFIPYSFHTHMEVYEENGNTYYVVTSFERMYGEVIEPTCTEDGYTERICTDENCGDIYKYNIVSAVGHDWIDWTDNGDGTCTGTCANDSSHVEIADHIDDNTDEICDNCGANLHVHQWSQWTFSPDGTTHTRVCLLDDSHTETEDHTGMETDCTCDVCGGANHVTHDNNMTDCDKCGAIFNEITVNAGDKVMFGAYNYNQGISNGVKMLDTSLDRFGKVIDISNGAFSFDPNRYALTIESVPGYEDSEGDNYKHFAYRTSYGKYLAIGEELIKVGVVEAGILSLSDEINNNSTWLTWIYGDYLEKGYSIYVLTSTDYNELGFASYYGALDEDYFILFYNNIDSDTMTVTYNYNNVNVGHDVTYTDNGDGTHTISCSICGIISENEPCYGGTATCTDKATCTGCGAGYGETTHTNIVIDNEVPATCTTTGLTAGSHCEDCGEVIVAQTVEPINENNHLWANGGTDNLDGITHTRVCTYDPSHTIVEPHSGARSCYCDVCGGEYHFTHDGSLSTCDGCSGYLFGGGSVPGGKVIICNSAGNMVFDASTPENFGKAIDNSDGKVFADLSRYLLTVEEGSISGSYAYKTPFGKYLAVSEEGQLIYIDEINDYSSWTNSGSWSGLTHAKRTDLALGINEGQYCTVNGGWTGVCVFDFTNVNVGHEVTYTDNGDGTHTVSCSICGLISANAPCYGGKATCTDKGICDVCNSSYGDALGHAYPDTWTDNGDGTHIKVCGNGCGVNLTETHTHEETSRVDATCENDGTITYTCVCGNIKTETIPATGHAYGQWNDDENGTTHTRVCEYDGNHVITEAHTHVETSDRVDATCENDGSVTYACECGNTYTETIPATGHDKAYTGEGNEATCEDVGTKRWMCKVCGEYGEDEAPALGHQYTVYVNNGDGTHSLVCANDKSHVEGTYPCSGGTATCESPAVCEFCSAEYILATGHDYPDTWTDNEDGTHIKVCGNGCGVNLTEAHSHTETGRVDATCESAGSVTYTCVCGNTYNATLTALGHDYPDTWTDKGDGTHIKVCANDENHVITEAHNHVETSRTPATCESAEIITYTCACGNSYTVEGAPATGHNYPDNWTDNGDGTHIKVCKNGCGINLVENHLADKKYHDNGTALYYATNKCSACGYYESLGEAVGSSTWTYVSSESDFIDAIKYQMCVYLEDDITITEPARISRAGYRYIHLQGHTLTATGVDSEGDGVMFYTSVDLKLNLYTEGGSFIVAPADESVENAYILKRKNISSSVTAMKVTIHAKDVGVDDMISTTGNTLFDIKVGTVEIKGEESGAYVNIVTNGNNPALVKDDGDDSTTVAITVTGGKFQGIDVTEYVDTATYNVVNENGTFVVSKK